jgi:DNA repair exonuclease SbcCD ATPase subunit
MSHHVAHNHRHPAVGQLEDVVPVPAHGVLGRAGEATRVNLETIDVGQHGWKEALGQRRSRRLAILDVLVEDSTGRLQAEVTDLNNKRNELVTSAIAAVSAQPNIPAVDAISKMTEEFAELKAKEKRHAEELERIAGRLAELNAFQQSVGAEIGRLERAQKAGDVLSNLQVTHCPVCDQSVKKPTAATDSQCYLCSQPILVDGKPLKEPLKRLEFELEQLKGERKEVGDLIEALSDKRRSNLEAMQAIRNRTALLSEQLRPVRVKTGAIIPAEAMADLRA